MTAAIASLLLQAIGLIGIAYLISDLLVLPGVLFADSNWTLAELFPYAIETVLGYWLAFLVPAIGATIAVALVQTGRFRAGWFLALCRIAGWIWVPILPIGPVLGFALLRSRARALRSTVP